VRISKVGLRMLKARWASRRRYAWGMSVSVWRNHSTKRRMPSLEGIL
jgi:hypothetical protein